MRPRVDMGPDRWGAFVILASITVLLAVGNILQPHWLAASVVVYLGLCLIHAVRAQPGGKR